MDLFEFILIYVCHSYLTVGNSLSECLPASARKLALFAALLVASVAQAQVKVVFIASSAADEYDASVYREIWDEYGDRVVDALETVTCLPFPEPSVSATVADAVSHSGGPEQPMQLRRSYIRKEKESTLVHELGHRHLWQLVERLDEVDGHMTLYLILDRVWADVWGEEFAAERVRGESDWHQRYADAWAWARSVGPEERARLWNQLLVVNGFDSCRSLVPSASGRPSFEANIDRMRASD